LKDVLGDSIQVANTESMHVLLRLPPNTDDVVLASQARAQGMAINALSPMGLRASTGPGLLLGFANIAPDAAKDAARLLKSALSTPVLPPCRSSRDERTVQLEISTS
jgi:GntR family transcriptional regulator/MocR family aminotransferase